MELSEVGTKFETLVNVQGNMLAWTPAEKEEMRTVTETVNALSVRAQAMTVPAVLESTHPLLIEAIGEMKQAIDGVAAIAEDPSKATDQFATDIEAHATKGEELADQYVASMEAALAAEYPELLED